MFNRFLVGAVVAAGAVVATTVVAELKKNEAIKSAGKNFADGAKQFGKEICKSAVNMTKASVDSIKDQVEKAKASNAEFDSEHVDDAGCGDILSSENGDIAVCAEGIKDTDEIQQDKFKDADTELSDDEIIDDTEASDKATNETDAEPEAMEESTDEIAE